MKPIPNMLKETSARIKKIFWVLGLYAFLVILFFIFIDFILGGFIFYKYVFLTEKAEPKITQTILKFNTGAYQNVMREIQAREGGGEESSAVEGFLQ